jgi:hypothetical protein
MGPRRLESTGKAGGPLGVLKEERASLRFGARDQAWEMARQKMNRAQPATEKQE